MKLPPRPMNALTLSRCIASQTFDRVQPEIAWRGKSVLLGQPIERGEIGLLGDADGALALHVGMAAHRADAGARLADIAAQQQQIRQHLHGAQRHEHAASGPCHRCR